MSKKIIIFDLDDTLISEREYIKSGFDIIALELSKKYKVEFVLIREEMDKLFLEDSKNLFNRVLDKFNCDYDQDYIISLIKLYRNHTPKIKLYDDAKKILEYLKDNGYSMGLITDGYKESQRKKIEVLDIQKYFEQIIVTDELGREFWKPSKVPYSLMKENFRCDYKDMVYIGDNIQKDFVTANCLGIETIQIVRENGVYINIIEDVKYHAKIKIKSLDEIKKNLG
ncbi:MAG: HAD family hydrolase [Cetobacterium sp.]|uniref:HAD family hydrolase n=1 Tax=Cetobacterium sp. TaxID=2071632 RepID=UPI003F3E9D49